MMTIQPNLPNPNQPNPDRAAATAAATAAAATSAAAAAAAAVAAADPESSLLVLKEVTPYSKSRSKNQDPRICRGLQHFGSKF